MRESLSYIVFFQITLVDSLYYEFFELLAIWISLVYNFLI